MRPVAVVGTGSIGVAFALLFARAGTTVRMWDAIPSSIDRAQRDLEERLVLLGEHDLLSEPAEVICRRVTFHEELGDALAGVALVQECAPEQLELKRQLFRTLGDLAPGTAVLASSSSAIVPSAYAAGLIAGSRILGAHPGNPPYLLPVIEIVPSPTTSSEAIVDAMRIYRAAGLRPVLVRKEVEGFIFNRLQGAVLREAYCLVRDGVASVDDVDEIVRSGLGLRWAFMGPFETVDVNTRGGIATHAERLGPAYERMGAERGQHDPWTPDLVAQVVDERRSALPLDEWEDRVRWRDERLMQLLALKERLGDA